jgi:hypothetical protein
MSVFARTENYRQTLKLLNIQPYTSWSEIYINSEFVMFFELKRVYAPSLYRAINKKTGRMIQFESYRHQMEIYYTREYLYLLVATGKTYCIINLESLEMFTPKGLPMFSNYVVWCDYQFNNSNIMIMENGLILICLDYRYPNHICELHVYRNGQKMSLYTKRMDNGWRKFIMSLPQNCRDLTCHINTDILKSMGREIDICTPLKLRERKCRNGYEDVHLRVVRECAPIYFCAVKKLFMGDVVII